ncbi:249_t:CDS:2 [Funneliformis mosseae]|uniref:249_t:CDS:1 n=1 Tax=Funneliformis mosseae TaxID=27381 RepID=A0A9N9H9N7_FUNMO|nr:249_t:CDS:2 [Funneliformis mosseae]
MFRKSKSLIRSKAGKSKGTIIDIPGKQIGPTPIIIPQSSNSLETNSSNKDVRGGENEKRQSIPIISTASRNQENNDSTISVMETRSQDIKDSAIPSTQYETNSDVIVINEEGSTIDVVSQASQDILMDDSQFMLQAKTRSSVEQSKSSEDKTQRRSLQKFPTSPKIILSFTNDSVVKSSSSSNSNTSHKSVIESQSARQDDAATSQHTNVEESDVATEDSSVRSRQRKAPNSRSKKRTRSNNDDEHSEDSTLATSSSSKQSKRRKRSSSVTSITSSTNTDGSSTKSNSTATGKKRRSKPRKPRSTTRKQQTNKSRAKPWEDGPEDENPLDDSTVTMAELCKDLKRGRKSNTYKELEYAKYQKSQQKRRQRDNA